MSTHRNGDTIHWDANTVRQAQERFTEEPRGRRRFSFWLYLLCVLLVSALLAGGGWLLANDLCSLNKPYVEREITVEEGESVSAIAQKLKEAGLINYRSFFCLAGKFFHAEKTIDPGQYTLDSNMDYRCLISSMHDYDKEHVVRVTIPEGLTTLETFALLEDEGVCSSDDLKEAAAGSFVGYDFLDEDKVGSFTQLEGFLFPDTYDFYMDSDPESVLTTMLNNFTVRVDDNLRKEIADSGHSLHDIITMASIIEREGTGNLEERKNIASVLYNRINNPYGETVGLLQLDTTIYYALAIEGRDKTEFTTDLDSPYNTYIYTGLPAGPISNPGLTSIRAAANPNETDYYFFAAGKDGVNHFFTYSDEHYAFINSDMYQPDFE